LGTVNFMNLPPADFVHLCLILVFKTKMIFKNTLHNNRVEMLAD